MSEPRKPDDAAAWAMWHEYQRAREIRRPMRSGHEGYAILLEEVDELWQAVKKQDKRAIYTEAKQVAAMALAMMAEVGECPDDRT